MANFLVVYIYDPSEYFLFHRAAENMNFASSEEPTVGKLAPHSNGNRLRLAATPGNQVELKRLDWSRNRLWETGL